MGLMTLFLTVDCNISLNTTITIMAVIGKEQLLLARCQIGEIWVLHGLRVEGVSKAYAPDRLLGYTSNGLLVFGVGPMRVHPALDCRFL